MVRVGLIGTGVALRTHLPGFRRTGRADVAGLVGSSRVRAEMFAAQHGIPRVYDDYRAMCEDDELDLVVVAGPNDRHHAEIQYALACGRHVLAEKPLAMTMAEVDDLVRLAAATDRLALIDHQLRFDPHIRAVQASIRNGVLGRLYFIRFHFQGGSPNPDRPFSWHYDEKQGGGVRLAMASHLSDLLWFWLGAIRVHNVHGRMDAVVPDRRDPQGGSRPVRTAGFFTAHLSLAGGLEVQMTDTPTFGEGSFTIDFYGTRGELRYDASSGLQAAFQGGSGLQPVAIDPDLFKPARPEGSVFRKSFDLFAPRLVAAIRTGDASHVKDAARFADAVPTQRVLDAIRESAVSGETVELGEGYSPGARF